MKRTLPILLLLLAIACFWRAAAMQQPLVRLRRAMQLDRADPLENSPPLVAFTQVALGGFRGMIADLLWLRAANLQQEGKCFELVQLADWITKLEPRYATVWAFHAWNMAYNVSVMFNDPEDRWRWVRHGIELLRDDGLHYNPGDANLYRELGWIFQHKMGAFQDQANHYYKEQWAREMMALFDGPRPDYATLIAAPRSREDLLDRPGAAELSRALRALGQDPFDDALLDTNRLSAPVRARLEASPAAPDWLAYLRARRMRETYKLDPAAMQKVDAEYGPLDWRLPQAHAIYWACQGQKYASPDVKVALQRMIFQSLADAFYQGHLFYNAAEGTFLPSPNLALLPRVQKAYEQAIHDHPDQRALQTAHRNFLQDAILVFYTYHRIGEARNLLEYLNQHYPSPETSQGLDYYVYRNYTVHAKDLSAQDMIAYLEGILGQSYFWLALGDDDRAVGYQQMARLAWNKYMEYFSDQPSRERVGLPPLDELARIAADQVRETLRSPEARERLLKAMPPPAPPPAK